MSGASVAGLWDRFRRIHAAGSDDRLDCAGQFISKALHLAPSQAHRQAVAVGANAVRAAMSQQIG